LGVVTYIKLLQNLQSAFPSSFGVGGPLHPEHAHGRTRDADAGCTRATTRSGAERRAHYPTCSSRICIEIG
ncbi:hypothetical protein ALC60_12546, partial [Trachymyrmex zeteki]